MENKTKLVDIRKNYANLFAIYRDEENTLCGKILAKERQLQRLEAKKRTLNKSFPCWTELLLRPVLDQLKLALPDWLIDDDELTPMGIGARVTVFFIKNDAQAYEDKYAKGNSIYITFLPGDLKMSELLYQTGESRNDSKPVESIDEIIEFLKKQIKTNGNC
jgi:hypothetical protein